MYSGRYPNDYRGYLVMRDSGKYEVAYCCAALADDKEGQNKIRGIVKNNKSIVKAFEKFAADVDRLVAKGKQKAVLKMKTALLKKMKM